MTDDWSTVDRTVFEVLHEFGGVAQLRAFVSAGLVPEQVASAFRRGVLERPRKGWYCDPALPWRAKCAIRAGGLLSCVSSADSFGLPVPVMARRFVHVQLPGNAPRVRHHRDRRRYVVPGEDREVVRHWSIADGTPTGWRVSLVDTLLQLADCVPLDWWIAALDAALHRPRDREPLLSEEGWSELRRRVPKRLLSALDLVDPKAESVIETLLRLAMHRRGIVPVLSQFRPHPAHRADFLVGRRLLVEADGEAFHDPAKDAARDAFLLRLGYVVIRFDYWRITTDIDAVLDEIEAALSVV